MVIEGFCASVESAIANARRGKGGQHVPFHGDFASATPSVIRQLEWWMRAMKATINSTDYPHKETP